MELARRLIDQERAEILVSPKRAEKGYWFGGGNAMVDGDGSTWLVGRYRNAGDSRTGLGLGERGAELVVLEAHPGAGGTRVIHSFDKSALSRPGCRVLSIEGSCLLRTPDGVELFVSSEKEQSYPEPLRKYQKPGTGVWSIDVIRAPTVGELDPAAIETLLESADPAHLHVKDPFVYNTSSGQDAMIYCTHPFGWSSSNSGFCIRPGRRSDFGEMHNGFFPRGATWDVAMSRITCALGVPRRGVFSRKPPAWLYFYDGGECVRSHDEHERAATRPRGYSCEELGGLAWGWEAGFPEPERLSTEEPLFLSPYATGSSRYVHAVSCEAGIWALWQRSQPDGSQPLMHHLLDWSVVDSILG